MSVVLPKEIILYCCSFLPCLDIYKLRNMISPLHTIETFYEKVQFIKRCYPKSIIDAMGGLENFLTFPILEWKNHFIGFTDYIDRINPLDVSHSIMIGKDVYNRAFITLKLNKGVYIHDFVITLFQRYSNDHGTWTHGKRGSSTFIEGCGYFLNNGNWSKENKNLKHDLSDLCHGKTIVKSDTTFRLAKANVKN